MGHSSGSGFSDRVNESQNGELKHFNGSQNGSKGRLRCLDIYGHAAAATSHPPKGNISDLRKSLMSTRHLKRPSEFFWLPRINGFMNRLSCSSPLDPLDQRIPLHSLRRAYHQLDQNIRLEARVKQG